MLKATQDVLPADLKATVLVGQVANLLSITLVVPLKYLERKTLGQIGALGTSHAMLQDLMFCSSFSNVEQIQEDTAWVKMEVAESYLSIFYRDLIELDSEFQLELPEQQDPAETPETPEETEEFQIPHEAQTQ